MRSKYAATLVLAVLSCAAGAAELSQDDFDYFKDNSYSQYGEPDPAYIEDQFFEIARRAQTPSEAVAEFSSDLGVTTEVAQRYAIVLVAAVKFRETCDEQHDQASCAFEPGTTLFDALLESGFEDKSGRVAVSIGLAILSLDYSDWQKAARSTFMQIVYKHPARTSIYSALYDYTGELEYAAVLAASEPESMDGAVDFRYQADQFSSAYCTAAEYGTFLALLEIARRKALENGRNDSTYLTYTEAWIWAELWLGLNAKAVEDFRDDSAGLLRNLADPPPIFLNNADRLSYLRKNGNLLLDLAYALFAAGDSDGASGALTERRAILEAIDEKNAADTTAADVLHELMFPSLSADELYDMALYGRLQNPKAELDDESANGSNQGKRWLFTMTGRPEIARSAFADRLKTSGLDGMADFLVGETDYECEGNDDPLARVAAQLPESILDSAHQWSNRIAQLSQTTGTERSDRAKESAVTRNGSSPLSIEEHDVPSEYLRPHVEQVADKDCDDDYEDCDYDYAGGEENLVPENVDVPVDPSAVVRYSQEGGERHIVYLSAAIDRPGEIPAYGLWYQGTFNGGRSWAAPLYLGIQQYFPYVVAADSNLPLLADGRLQIEVEVKEIDPQTITFPPVGLGFKRQQRDLYISMDLADLQRDSDKDYLTDVVEYRLGLDPTNPDTDGDGVPDGIDSLPLIAYDPDAPKEDTELAFAILETVFGYERAALMVQPSEGKVEDDAMATLDLTSSRIDDADSLFLVADPKIFSGVRLEDRLLVYSEDDIKQISAGQAPFYPARISHVFRKSNGREFYVIWSASWVGGEFIVRCIEDGCTVEITSSWIT